MGTCSAPEDLGLGGGVTAGRTVRSCLLCRSEAPGSRDQQA